ncbi:hypothetical protein ACFV1U_21405 [Streptomyces microflavus]|uniref:hypothetical protein n=1 Tax=Streptomyces microflavus TaxID=1919 RepID=UPI0036A855B8
MPNDQHPEQFPQRGRTPSHRPPADPGPDRALYPRQIPSPVAAVLSGTLGWRLSPEGWEAVGQALDELAAVPIRPPGSGLSRPCWRPDRAASCGPVPAPPPPGSPHRPGSVNASTTWSTS